MWPFKGQPKPDYSNVKFNDLNAPFPLFEAPVSNASDFHGKGQCSICGRSAEVCFELGIGSALIQPCPKCQTETGLDASDKEDQICKKCGATIYFPPIAEEKVLCCYACLRAGRAAITKDTEIGMISWEQAFEGMTHGRPGLKHPDFELVPTDSDWIRARLPQAVMFELLRTPTYDTIQGDQWQFCCKQPMVFLGEWNREDFHRNAPDGQGHAYFQKIVQGIVPGLWEDNLHDVNGIYVFRCSHCNRMTAHWDLA
jgi:uncharacterized protein CbrC (UPF0167 family)